MERLVHFWDDILAFMTVQRLDSKSIKGQEKQLKASKKLPNWDQLQEFLMTGMLSLQTIEVTRPGKSSSCQSRNVTVRLTSARSKANTQGKCCPIRQATYHITHCPKFYERTSKQRLDSASRSDLCYNCLGTHRVVEYHLTKCCFKYRNRHHCIKHTYATNETKFSNKVFFNICSR